MQMVDTKASADRCFCILPCRLSTHNSGRSCQRLGSLELIYEDQQTNYPGPTHQLPRTNRPTSRDEPTNEQCRMGYFDAHIQRLGDGVDGGIIDSKTVDRTGTIMSERNYRDHALVPVSWISGTNHTVETPMSIARVPPVTGNAIGRKLRQSRRIFRSGVMHLVQPVHCQVVQHHHESNTLILITILLWEWPGTDSFESSLDSQSQLLRVEVSNLKRTNHKS